MRIRTIIQAILMKVGYLSFEDLVIRELTSDATLYYIDENGNYVHVKYPSSIPIPDSGGGSTYVVDDYVLDDYVV